MSKDKKQPKLFTIEDGKKWADCDIEKKDMIYIEGEATYEGREFDDKYVEGGKNKFIKFRLTTGELVSVFASSKKGQLPTLGRYNHDTKQFESFRVRLMPKYYSSFKAYFGLKWVGIKPKDDYWEEDYHCFKITDACDIIDLDEESVPDKFDTPSDKDIDKAIEETMDSKIIDKDIDF